MSVVRTADSMFSTVDVLRVSDGIRTRDRLDHNQELYQLSYAHRAGVNLAGRLEAEAP
jgi:hypothetical protein